MALRLPRFNLLSKISISNSIVTVRCRCKVPNVTFESPQSFAKPRTLRFYFTSIHRDLQFPKKAEKSAKYSYDVNIDVPNHVLLYSDGDRHTLFGLVQVFSIGAFMIFALIGDTIRQVLGQLKKSPMPEGEPIKWYQWWKRLRPDGKLAGYFLFFVLSAVGLMLAVFGHMYPARMVCSVWLLQGGRSISLSTYKSWGRIKTTKLPLKEISCENAPNSVDRYIPFKVKGKSLYFLVDKKKGKIYNDRLFHGAFALKRPM